MKYITNIISFILILLTLTSCSYDNLAEKIIPKEESEFAKAYILRLKNGDFDYVKSIMSAEVLAQVDDTVLKQMSGHFHDGKLLSSKIIGSQVKTHNSEWNGNFTFEYEFESGWNVANAALKKVGNGYEVTGLNVYQTEKSLKEIHAFSMASKSVLHYIILLLAIVVPLFIIITTFFCFRTPIQKRKWLWVIFVLSGFGSISINWSSGVYLVQPISFQLFGASVMRAGSYAPWLISCSIPLGAIIFWFKRRGFIEAAKLAEKAPVNTEVE